MLFRSDPWQHVIRMNLSPANSNEEAASSVIHEGGHVAGFMSRERKRSDLFPRMDLYREEEGCFKKSIAHHNKRLADPDPAVRASAASDNVSGAWAAA